LHGKLDSFRCFVLDRRVEWGGEKVGRGRRGLLSFVLGEKTKKRGARGESGGKV
jgi:hypothetical protein